MIWIIENNKKKVITIETYYLIDFENVNMEGLDGSDKLEKNDRIYVFGTSKTKIRFESDIPNHGKAKWVQFEVPIGNQSVDMHIVSYVGFLIGQYADSKCKIVIVSKDKDYDNIIKFWMGYSKGIRISRTKSIKNALQKSTTKQVQKQPIKGANKYIRDEITAMGNNVRMILVGYGYPTKKASYVASRVNKYLGNQDGKMMIQNALKEEYGSEGIDMYNVIKPFI